MKVSFSRTINAVTHNKYDEINKITLDSPRGIALFHGKDGAVGLTIALDRTDNSLVNFYRYGVNATHPFKLYKSECLYSRGEHFEYSDWLLRTVTDEFSECEYTLEQLFSML